MDMYKPGVFRNKDGKQLVSFEGMNIGLQCLSSIEACQEYKGKAYFFFLPKYKTSAVTIGQRIMYERMVEDLAKAGKVGIVAVVRHETPHDEPILLKDCIVSSLKIGYSKWRKTNWPMTALELRDYCVRTIDNNPAKAMSWTKNSEETVSPANNSDETSESDTGDYEVAL